MLRKLKSSLFISLLISTFLYLISIHIVSIDLDFKYRWVAFFIWIASVSFFPTTLLIRKIITKTKLDVSRNGLLGIITILFISLVLNFSFLREYPFVSIYDQVRDGGLNAAQIADGTIKNIFSYGRYASHSLIIPTITSFFYEIFENSVFTFRVPSGVLMSLSTIVIYLIMRRGVSQFAGFFSAIVFSTLSLVLYYSRTEVVVAFSTFLFTLIFLFVSEFLKKREYQLYALGGLLLGFSSGFHTSIRTMAILCLGLILLLSIYDYYKERALKKTFISLILVLVFFIIGFGPRILFTTPDIFFQTRSFALNNTTETKNNFEISKIINNYNKSLFVYISEPTVSTHYPDFKPVLSGVASIFFIAGIIFAFIKRNKLMKTAVFFALIIPLSNSAITDTINSDNRFGPLFVIAAILTGYGIFMTLQSINKRVAQSLIAFALFLIFIVNGVLFFINEPASKNYNKIDYLSMHTVNLIQNDSDLNKLNRICIYANSTFYDYSQLYHVQEQYQFFLPKKYFYVIGSEQISSNEIYLSKNCNGVRRENYKRVAVCQNKEKFICSKGPFFFYKEIVNDGFQLTPIDEFFTIKGTPAFIP